MDPEVIRKVEAVLFASGRFMDSSRIAELIGDSEKHVNQALEALRKNYIDAGGSLVVREEDGAWKLHVIDEYLDLVSRVVSDTEVSGPVLETLAVIAWRSPVLQADVVNIRGSNTYEHIKELVEQGFVKKEPEGRSYRLRITEKFFDYFDIEGREDIRKVFMEVEEAHRKKEMEVELEQKRLAEAIRKAEEGDVVEVDIPVEEQKKLPDKKVNIENLDEVLEKSAKTREKIGAELSSIREKKEITEDSEASEEDAGGESDAEQNVDEQLTDTKTDSEEPEVETSSLSDEDLAEESTLEPVESSDDPDLDEAKKIRERVEKEVDEL